MNKHILVLNVEVSGMNKYLFCHLEKRGWDLTIINVPFPRVLKFWALISTFRLSISQWKKRFSEKLGKLYKTSWAFKKRSEFCTKKIRQCNGKLNLVFQISGMFAPYLDHMKSPILYVTYNDYTMALAKKYLPWTPFSKEADKWIELERNLYRNAKMIFTTSENTRESLIKDYGIESEKTISVGYPLTLEKIPDFPKTYDGKTILFIGMDFERKGGYVLLEAFKKVKNEIPDAKLIIIGPNKGIFKINELGVEMLGCVKDRKIIEEQYKQASIFVMPSLCEPFGLVFLEAMAYKLPCIGTTVDAMPEIIQDGITGFLVPPGDACSLAEKMVTLLNEPEILAQMGNAGYRRVKENFSWDKVGEKLDFYLKECLNAEKSYV